MRLIKSLIISFLTLFLLLILFAPSFLSTEWGTDQITKWSEKEGQLLRIEKISLSWFGSQKIKNLHFEEGQKGRVIDLKEAILDAPLWRLLFSSNYLNRLTIQEPYIRLTKQESISPKPHEEGSPVLSQSVAAPFIFFGEIQIKNGRLDLKGWKEEITLSPLNMIASRPGPDLPFEISLTGRTVREKIDGTFEVNLAADNLQELTKARFKAQGEVENFPSAIIDAFTSSSVPPNLFHDLLGDLFNFQMALTTSDKEQNFAFTVESLKGKGGLTGKWDGKEIALTGPAKFEWTLSPTFFNLFPELVLEKDTPFTAEAQRFSISTTGDLSSLDIQGALTFSEAPMKYEGMPLNLNDFKGEAFVDTADKITFQASSKITAPGLEKGSFSFFSEFDRASQTLTSFKTEWQEVPTGLAAPFIPQAQELLGDRIHLKSSAKKEGEVIRGKFEAVTPHLKINPTEFIITDDFSLIQPLEFTFLTKTPFPYLPYAVTGGFEGAIHSFQMPLEKSLESFEKGAFRFSGKTTLLDLSALPEEFPLQTLEFKDIEIQKQNNASITFDGSLEAKHRENFEYALYLNGPMIVNFNGTGGLDRVESLIVKGKNKNFEMQTHLASSSLPNIWETIEETKIAFTFPDASLPELEKGPALNLTIAPFAFDAFSPLLPQVRLNGKGAVDSLKPRFAEGNLENLQFDFALNCPEEAFEASLTATPRLPNGETGSLQAQIKGREFLEEDRFNTDSLYLESLAKIEKLTPNILSPLLGNIDLEPFFGPEIALTYLIQIDDLNTKPTGSLNYTIKGEYLTSEGALKLEDTIKAEGPLTLSGILTPKLMRMLSPRLELAINAPYEATLSEFSLPRGDFWGSSLKGSIKIGDLDLSQVVFQSTFSEFSSPQLRELIGFSVQSRSLDQKTKERGSLNIRGTLSNLSEDSSNWMKEADLDFNAEMDRFPLASFFEVVTTNPYTQDLIRGISANELSKGYMRAELKEGSGHASLVLDNPSSKIKGDFNIRSGLLSFESPFTAEMKLTADLIQGFLGKLNPIFRSALPSDHMITLKIDKEGTYYDLNALEPLTTAAFENSMLDVGKIRFRREGIIANILGFLDDSLRDSEVDIWFTPFYASMKNGVYRQKREDFLLANRYPMAIWGNVDIPREYIDMILGVDSWTLERAAGVSGLPEDYMMLFPIKGPFGNAKIDTTKAIARIAALRAQAVEDKTVKTIGTLFNVIAAPKAERKDIPEPTTSPLPWADEIRKLRQEKKKEQEKEKDTLFKNPVKKEDDQEKILPFDLPKLFR